MKPRQNAHFPQFGTIFVFAIFCALGVVLLCFGKPADRPTAWICIGLFGSMALLGGVWEVGRHHQGEGVRWQRLKIEGVDRSVWFFPASRLQQFLLLATMLIMVATTVSICAFGNTSFQRWQAVVAAIFLFGIFLPLIFSALIKTRGIALLPSGIVWFKEKHPLHIPWDAIEAVVTTRVGQDVGHGVKTYLPAVGLHLKPTWGEQLSEIAPGGRRTLTSTTRAKLTAHKTQNGCELTYFDEALVLPVEEAARLLNFFLNNPIHCRELQAGQTQLGFLEALLRSDAV